jgi:hypothetical protein
MKKDKRKILVQKVTTDNTTNGHARWFWVGYTRDGDFAGIVEYTGASDFEWRERWPEGIQIGMPFWLTPSRYKTALRTYLQLDRNMTRR